MALTLHVCPGDTGAFVWASGDVDTNVAETFQDIMLSVMRGHSPSLLLDLSGVSFMDCAGLRALLLTQRRAGLRGGSVSLIAESPAVRRIIDLLGVRDLLPVRERLSELSALLLSLLGGANCSTSGPSGVPRGFRPGPRLAGEPVRSADVRRPR
jgi:stage II sporulation protein AA (anti-sigma F factor antagonist)